MKIKYSNWFGNTQEANIHIITDNKQKDMITEIMSDIDCISIKYLNVETDNFDLESYEQLRKEDLVIAALSIESFIDKGMNKFFSPFRKPIKLSCKYAFIRLDISAISLREGLLTDKSIIEKEITTYQNIENNSNVRVTAPGGTDLSLKINKFKTCKHFINDESDIAFLPPSELEAGICLGTANGEIVIDVTVGQINQYGKWIGYFGLVEKPVKLIIENSQIIDVINNDELKEILFKLEKEARVLVELGKGLSAMTPTGIIGVDESILTTCHFGIGDGSIVNIDNSASIHLDVVINNPTISIEKQI